MNNAKGNGDDWLSSPVGKASVASSDASAAAGSVTSAGSKYKSAFTNDLASGSLYPTGGTSSPALDADLSPGPATSVGLGSASSRTSTGIRRASAAGPRRAKLQIRHIDPWSTLKLSLVLAVAFFFVWMIAVAILYGVMTSMGVFDSVESMFNQLGTSASAGISPKVVFGGAALIGAINIVLFTAMATISAYIYNLCADLAGGLEITLAERQ